MYNSCDPFLLEELTCVESELRALRGAMSEASADGIYSYSFSTGQTTQSVTKNTLAQMQNHRQSLLTERSTLRQLLGLEKASFQAIANW